MVRMSSPRTPEETIVGVAVRNMTTGEMVALPRRVVSCSK